MTKKTPFQYLNIFYLSVIFIMPFLISMETIEPVLGLRFLALSGFLLILIFFISFQYAKGDFKFDYPILKRGVFLTFFTYLIISSASLVTTLTFTEGFSDLLKILLFFIFLFLTTILLLNDKKLIYALSIVITLVSLILSLIGLCQYFDIAFRWIPGNFIIHATMTNKNLLSTGLVLMFPFVAFSIFHFSDKWFIISLLTLFFSGLVVGLSHTKSSWVAFCGGVFFVVIFILVFRRKLKFPTINQKKLHYIVITLICAILISIFIDQSVIKKSDPIRRAITASNTNVSSTNERLMIWKKSLRMFADHPISGVGLGSWKLMLPLYGTEGLRSQEGKIHFVRPHNDFLWVLTETGILGFLSFCGIFGFSLFYIYRLLLNIKDTETKLLLILTVFGIIAYLMVSLISFPKERIFHSTMLMILFAIPISFYHQNFRVKALVSSLFVYSVNLLFIFILGISVYVGYSRIQSEIHLRDSLRAQSKKNWNAEIEALNKAETAFFDIDPMATPISFYRGIANVRLNQLDEVAVDLEKAHNVHPNHIMVLLNYGVSCDREGKINQAEEIFKKILQISPQHEQARLNLIGILIKQQKYQMANEELGKCNPKSKDPRIEQYKKLIEKALESAKE